jgi:hypothetical protein
MPSTVILRLSQPPGMPPDPLRSLDFAQG